MTALVNSGGSDVVTVNVSNSKNNSVAFEIKFAKRLTVADLKSKLEPITGGSRITMKVQVYNGDKLVCTLDDDQALLGSFPVDSGMRLHVIDNFEWFAENVEKFELNDSQYEDKTDTVRNFLKTNRIGKYNEEELRQKEEKRRQLVEQAQAKADLCTVGSRCQVTVPGNPTRRGTVMYKGPLEGKNGTFIGVRYDEPLGKNDGSVEGKRYFTCPDKYGGFVAPLSVDVGDFPPEDFNVDDEL